VKKSFIINLQLCLTLSVDSCVPKINLSLKDDCDCSPVLSIVLSVLFIRDLLLHYYLLSNIFLRNSKTFEAIKS